MIEVFKTDVKDHLLATAVRERIHRTFPRYRANFDLEDCDHILRVEHPGGMVQAGAVIDLLNHWGIRAEVLPDEVPGHHPFENGLPHFYYWAQMHAYLEKNR